MTAPDRIWAGTYETFETCGDWDVYKKADSDVVYVRSDLYEELRRSLFRITQIKNEMYGGDWDEIEKARMIAAIALS